MEDLSTGAISISEEQMNIPLPENVGAPIEPSPAAPGGLSGEMFGEHTDMSRARQKNHSIPNPEPGEAGH